MADKIFSEKTEKEVKEKVWEQRIKKWLENIITDSVESFYDDILKEFEKYKNDLNEKMLGYLINFVINSQGGNVNKGLVITALINTSDEKEIVIEGGLEDVDYFGYKLAKNKKVTIKGNVIFTEDQDFSFGKENKGTIIVDGYIDGKKLFVGISQSGLISAANIIAYSVGTLMTGTIKSSLIINAFSVGMSMKEGSFIEAMTIVGNGDKSSVGQGMNGVIKAATINAFSVGEHMYNGTIMASNHIEANSVGEGMKKSTINAELYISIIGSENSEGSVGNKMVHSEIVTNAIIPSDGIKVVVGKGMFSGTISAGKKIEADEIGTGMKDGEIFATTITAKSVGIGMSGGTIEADKIFFKNLNKNQYKTGILAKRYYIYQNGKYKQVVLINNEWKSMKTLVPEIKYKTVDELYNALEKEADEKEINGFFQKIKIEQKIQKMSKELEKYVKCLLMIWKVKGKKEREKFAKNLLFILRDKDLKGQLEKIIPYYFSLLFYFWGVTKSVKKSVKENEGSWKVKKGLEFLENLEKK